MASSKYSHLWPENEKRQAESPEAARADSSVPMSTGEEEAEAVASVERFLGLAGETEPQPGQADRPAGNGPRPAGPTTVPAAPTAAKEGDPGADPTPFPSGEIVAGHEILGELGRGGMGVVYQARHLRLGRVVALKVLSAAAHASPAQRARFQAESQAVARLQHPNIVQVFEVGEHGGLPFFSMEYFAGGNLAQRLAGTPLDAGAAAAITETLARAVHYAHERGIVHRDLKPANVLLAVDGCQSSVAGEETPAHTSQTTDNRQLPGILKITDFGLAKRLDASEPVTGSGAVLGTPSYMAPEQAGSKGSEVGPVTDVYALGAVLYELVTGRPPFKGPTPMETLAQVVADEPIRPRQVQPRLPRDLETICLRCLEKEPEKRYPSAVSLAADLRRFQERRPIKARPVGRLERSSRWCRRNPVLAGSVAAVLLATTAGTAVASYYAVRANDSAGQAWNESVRANKEADDARNQAEETRKALRLAEKRLYISDMHLVQRAWEDGDMDRLKELLEGQRPERTGGLDLRGFEWHYWWHKAHGPLFTLPGQPRQTWDISFSPDGKLVAKASGNTVQVFNLATMQESPALKVHESLVRRVQFSPDGKRLVAASSEKTARVWDAITGKELVVIRGHAYSILDAMFDPSGGFVATVCKDAVYVWDSFTGKRVAIWGEAGEITAAGFSPDGLRMAVAYSVEERRRPPRFHVKIKEDWQTGAPSAKLEGCDCRVSELTFGPDSSRLATAGVDKKVRVWDVSNGQCLATLEHPEQVSRLAYHPDGVILASAAEDKNVRLWDTVTNQQLAVIRAHNDGVTGVAFSPDGRRLATASRDGTAKIWDLLTQRDPFAINANCCCLIGTASRDGTAKIWDPSTLPDPFVIKATCGRLSPDGRRLATSTWTSQAGGRHAAPAPDEDLRVWDLASRRALLSWQAIAGYSLSFSSDGQFLAAPIVGGFQVWNASTAKEVLSVTTDKQSAASVVQFSPKGPWLAVIRDFH
jgi:serine/threonine protein kinase/WD40 repeat protein